VKVLVLAILSDERYTRKNNNDFVTGLYQYYLFRYFNKLMNRFKEANSMSDQRRKAENVNANDEVLQWVTFKLAKETYGINVMQVQEVLRYTEIAPVPGSPLYVLGIINLRGNVVTVIDTRARFGLEPADVTDNTRIVIIEAEKQVIGILVDSVAEVVYLKASEIDAAPNVGNDESAKFIQGVSNRDGELLILVDLDKLLSDDEWDELKHF